jgi:uncharacterized coiled-coil protein SlyX
MSNPPDSSVPPDEDSPNGPLEALERQVGGMRDTLQTLASDLPLEAERLRRLTESCLAMQAGLSRIETVLSADAVAISEMNDRIALLEARAVQDAETLVKLATAVARAQRQLDFNAEEARKTAAGLLAMIGAPGP